MKFRLVENWRSLWRAFSLQAMTLSSAILTTWGLMPDDMKAGIAPGYVMATAGGVLVLGIIGRYLRQDKVSGSDPEPDKPVA